MSQVKRRPIGQVSKDYRNSNNLTVGQFARRVRVSDSTVRNFENSKPLTVKILEMFASRMGLSLDEISEVIQSDIHVGPAPTEGQLQFFGMRSQARTIDCLSQHVREQGLIKARIVAFTVHTLSDLLIELRAAGIRDFKLYIGTKDCARNQLQSSRQEELFDGWFGLDTRDFLRDIKGGCITFRFFRGLPCFTGAALAGNDGEDQVIWLNHYVFTPTLWWLRDNDIDAYEAHWESMPSFRLPDTKDDYTINACQMPSYVAVRSDAEDPNNNMDDPFLAAEKMFNLFWRTHELDADHPRAEGTIAAIDEMQELYTGFVTEGASK